MGSPTPIVPVKSGFQYLPHAEGRGGQFTHPVSKELRIQALIAELLRIDFSPGQMSSKRDRNAQPKLGIIYLTFGPQFYCTSTKGGGVHVPFRASGNGQ
jgi:hypothetical protein